MSEVSILSLVWSLYVSFL